MNLLLLSLGLGALGRFSPPPLKLGFVPTAGEPYDDPSFVTSDRRRLIHLGYEVIDLDISRLEGSALRKALDGVEALFIAGGNTFYLMQQIRSRDLVEPFRAFVASGRPYIGASAGAVICGPSLVPIQTLDDPKAAPDLLDFSGLSIVDFVVLPHYGKAKYLPRYEHIEARYGSEFRLVKLKDDEALIVSAGGSIVSTRSEIILAEI